MALLQLRLTNPASPGDKTATLKVGTAGKLDVSIVNKGNKDIALNSGATLKIFFPSFMDDAVGQISGTLTDWSITPITTGQKHIELKYTGSGGSLQPQAAIAFTLTNILSKSAANHGRVDLKPAGFTGGLVIGLPAKIALEGTVKAAAPALRDVLGVTPTQMTVYRSNNQDVLKNTVELNLKNKKINKPLFEGQHAGNPRILVSFTYGDQAGAIAPAGKAADKALGTAFGISGVVSSQQGGDWEITLESQVTDGVEYPQWKLEPKPGNKAVIQSGENANVTFQFSNIITKLDGHTQMIVQFIGFRKDDNTEYAPFIEVIDINKIDLPVTERGVTGFSCEDTLTINSWAEDPKVELSWDVAYASKVELEDNYGFHPKQTFDYDNGPHNHGNTTVSLKGFMQAKTIIFTLIAFDGNGNKLTKDDQQTLTINYPDVNVDFRVTSVNGRTNSPNFEVSIKPKALVQEVNLGMNGGGTRQVNDQNTDPNAFIYKADFRTFFNSVLNPLKNTLDLVVDQKFGKRPIRQSKTYYAPYIDPKTNRSYNVTTDGGLIWMAEDYDIPTDRDQSLGLNLCIWDKAKEYAQALGPGWRLATKEEWAGIARFSINSPYTDLPDWQKNDEMPFIKITGQLEWPDWLNIKLQGHAYGTSREEGGGWYDFQQPALGKDQCTGYWTSSEEGDDAVVFLFADKVLDGVPIAISRKKCSKNGYFFALRFVKQNV